MKSFKVLFRVCGEKLVLDYGFGEAVMFFISVASLWSLVFRAFFIFYVYFFLRVGVGFRSLYGEGFKYRRCLYFVFEVCFLFLGVIVR